MEGTGQFQRSKLERAERHAPGIESVAHGIFVGTAAGDSLDDVVLADGLPGVLTHSLDDGLPNPRNVTRDAIGILDGADDEWLDGIGKRFGGHRHDRTPRGRRLGIGLHQHLHDRQGGGATLGPNCEQAVPGVLEPGSVCGQVRSICRWPDVSKPLDPDLMTPAERLDEIAEILAAGILRVRGRLRAPGGSTAEQARVDFSPRRSGHVAPSGPRRR